jgi:hypothetical protein
MEKPVQGHSGETWATWTPQARGLAGEVAAHVLAELNVRPEQLDYSFAKAMGVPIHE